MKKPNLLKSILIGVLILFLASLSVARADEYVLGPEDVLEVSVWGHSDLSRIVTIRPDGKLSLPLIDEVEAAGLTPKQLDEEITKILSEHIPEPKVTVIVEEFNSKKIYMVGEVNKAGAYPIFGKTTLLEAISMAGGITGDANLKKGIVLRSDKDVSPEIINVDLEQIMKMGQIDKDINVDLEQTMKMGPTDKDILLKPGDVIYLPKSKIAKFNKVIKDILPALQAIVLGATAIGVIQ